MTERPLWLGPDGSLLGVLTEPAGRVPGAPVLLMLNAGLLHRVGPNRMHVDLARRLAERGMASLRLDLSGIGDSEFASRRLDVDRSRQDVVDAMDGLADRLGVDRFVLFGLCTGAFNAFRAALVDERVRGCVLIDGYGYPTPRSRWRHYRTRVFELDRWMGWIRRKLGSDVAVDAPEDLVVYENEVVPRERFAAELGALIDRDVAVLMAYTEYGPLAVNYPRQLHDAFPGLDLDRSVTVAWYPDTDHTFTLADNRRRLLDEVETWLATAGLLPGTPATQGRSA